MKLSTWHTSFLLALAAYVVCILAQSLPFGMAPTLWPGDPYNRIELVGFVSGVVGVYLMVKQSVLNYPVGLIWAVAYAWYFFAVARHFGEASVMILNAFYLLDGWIKWSRKSPAQSSVEGLDQSPLPVTLLEKRHWLMIGLTLAVAIPTLIWLLKTARGNYVYWDAATTALALTAQYLTNRKVFQSWHFWIAANVVIIPVFIYREYYPTAILYTIFTVMAFLGIKEWRESMRQSHPKTPATP